MQFFTSVNSITLHNWKTDEYKSNNLSILALFNFAHQLISDSRQTVIIKSESNAVS